MKVTDIWKSKQKPTISFELFPAKTEKTAESLEKAIDSLAALKPDFVSVTFGAGGSTREGSHQLVRNLKHERELKILAYFACYGLGPNDIFSALDSYQEIGVESILAVRGDTPQEKDFEPHPDSLPHASDLVSLIRLRYSFCIGVAGYPKGHIEAPSKEKDLEYLKLKVDRGAEYIIANYFYDNRYFFDFLERCRGIGIEVLGPVGMLLSLPLTMTAKIALDSREDTRWIAVLLGSQSVSPMEVQKPEKSSSKSK